MEVLISNKNLEVKINSFGAELISLKNLDKNIEYMWQKNPQYWNKCSPVLFPFVGAIKNNQYFYNGDKYLFSPKHGFARDNEFELLAQQKDCAEFIFRANENTKKIYPFNFNFYIKYILKKNSLQIEYKIENLEDKKMYFSLGAHPAFNTPLDSNTKYSDYFIEFEKIENGDVYFLEDSLFNTEKKKSLLTKNILQLTENIFEDDVLILKNTNSKKVYLKNKNGSFTLGFKFEGFKHLAFWSKPNAPYICLEPWNGLPDYKECTGNLEEKADIESIEAKEMYTRNIEIEIF